MTQEDREYVLGKIDNEGFDYSFTSYSDFSEIKDEEFHKLRLGYLEAVKKLTDFLTKQNY